jgi:hypothetical protein
MMKTAGPDWEAIEKAYRAGSVSVRSIADQFGVSEGTIRSRSKAQGWQRDLTERVRVATKEKISRTTSCSDHTQLDVRNDEQVVQDESSKRAGVVVAQIGRLERWTNIAQKLMKSLNDTEVTADNQAEFARALSAGVDVELKVIKAERQAYGIDDASHEESYESRLARLFEDKKQA